MKENLWGYNGNQKTPFLKIILKDPKLLARARIVFEQGEVQFLDMFQGSTLTFESNIQFLLRFMIDTKVPPSPSLSHNPATGAVSVTCWRWLLGLD